MVRPTVVSSAELGRARLATKPCGPTEVVQESEATLRRGRVSSPPEEGASGRSKKRESVQKRESVPGHPELGSVSRGEGSHGRVRIR